MPIIFLIISYVFLQGRGGGGPPPIIPFGAEGCALAEAQPTLASGQRPAALDNTVNTVARDFKIH